MKLQGKQIIKIYFKTEVESKTEFMWNMSLNSIALYKFHQMKKNDIMSSDKIY